MAFFSVGNRPVVELGPDDGDRLQQLVERCADYWELAFGTPPGSAEALSIMTVLPPDKADYRDKLVLGLESAADTLDAVVDVVRDEPRRTDRLAD